ncbi:cell wall hydrolase [Sphingobium sp. GW456-12-10-14-TSB1]|uniref:cell wall hydrolase n=2 Tax=Sphingomonadaceae TaxID=41297 RepID=UPI0002E209D0|nr:cell wall hydrolase [Sphingobium sp. GW456-12-10-14-TSB1]OUC55342.1 cell wall hydrolase [Sphingobium sp. GW456-12-10-14-TSB1]
MWIVWLALFAGLPAAVAGWEARAPREAGEAHFARRGLSHGVRPPSPPPPVEPVAVYALPADRARALNAAIPFSRLANPAARPFRFEGSETDLARAVDCLAAAQIYEAGDDAVGERAVAQVVLNRVRHPAFPKTVCGVVFQGQERTTGCQFTFSCDGALARTPSPAAWDRARAIARGALAGDVFKPVGYATHYHTDWVVPYWSGSLDKLTRVGTHLFFRWRGWWGTPPAFRTRTIDGGEPLIGRIARLSPAHSMATRLLPGAITPMADSADAIAAQARQAIGLDQIGKSVGGVRLIALADMRSFLVELPRGSKPDSWPESARTFCAGRSQCRIMGWTANDAPKELPLTLANLAAMRFSYIHDTQSGLQRALWNCDQTPRADKRDCMRRRVPVAMPAPPAPTGLAGVRRMDRFETVKIAPAPGTPPSDAQQP